MLGYTKRDMDGKAVVIWKAKGFRDMLSLRFSVKASKENDGCFTTPFPYTASLMNNYGAVTAPAI